MKLIYKSSSGNTFVGNFSQLTCKFYAHFNFFLALFSTFQRSKHEHEKFLLPTLQVEKLFVKAASPQLLKLIIELSL